MAGDSESRFESYVEDLRCAVRHAGRAAPLRAYCLGLMLPGDRKSVEPMAVRATVLPAIERHGKLQAWIIDDTDLPKTGVHSVGVARQYCGQLGKQDNCQVAVTLSVANDYASFPIAYRLYLPKDWASDPVRRQKAGVPAKVMFRTKPQIALGQVEAALAEGVAPGVVLADAGYGVDTAFRTGLSRLGLTYAVGIQSTASLWKPGEAA